MRKWLLCQKDATKLIINTEIRMKMNDLKILEGGSVCKAVNLLNPRNAVHSIPKEFLYIIL